MKHKLLLILFMMLTSAKHLIAQNVGIGITNPGARLSLGTSYPNQRLLSFFDGYAGNNGYGIGMEGNPSSTGSRLMIYTSNLYPTNAIVFGSYTGTTFTEKMRVEANGNIGIGTATPLGPFHVKSGVVSPDAIDQQQTVGTGNLTGGVLLWQSFTAGITGFLTKVELKVSSPIPGNPCPGTIKIFSGEGNGGTLLSTTSVTFQPGLAFQSFILSQPSSVLAGTQYTIECSVIASGVAWVEVNLNNPYAGGQVIANPTWDILFKTFVVQTSIVDALLVVNGNIGIGTTAPSQKLDVNGNSNFAGKIIVSDSALLNGSAKVTGNALIIGNTGIGTTTPSQKLDVIGNTSVTGKLMLSDSALLNGNAKVAGYTTLKDTVYIDKVIKQDSLASPTLLNSWVNYGLGFAEAKYYKDKEGVVHLRGLIKNGTITSNTILFTLPAGYRPSTSGQLIFTVENVGNMGRIDVKANGDVIVVTATSNLYLNLTGISFRAD